MLAAGNEVEARKGAGKGACAPIPENQLQTSGTRETMLELVDEFGRPHVKALREVARVEEEAEGSKPVEFVLLDANVPRCDWEAAAKEIAGWVAAKGGEYVYVRADVFSTLQSHGMLKPLPTGRADGSTEGWHRATRTRVRGHGRGDVALTARGRDFLSRRVLSSVLGVLPAKVNKWIAFFWAILAPLASLATCAFDG